MVCYPLPRALEIRRIYQRTLMEEPMNFWKFAAFVTGLVVVTAVVRKCQRKASAIASDPDHRYSIDDFIDDDEYESTTGDKE